MFVQPSDFIKNKDEYALSKDTDVVMWLHYRTFHNLSLPRDAFDFVIITEDLHRNFDEFRKRYIQTDHNDLEIVELLQHYLMRCKPNLTLSSVYMYGRAYLRLHAKELDDLCYWVQDQRNLHKIKGNLIFTQPVVEGNKYLLHNLYCY